MCYVDYARCCLYRVDPPDDEQQACSKHIEAYYWNKLMENSASCWFMLYGSLTLRRLMSYIYIYMEHPFLIFLDHTQRRSTVCRAPLDEWSARRRDLYLTTHDTHNRQISMPPVGFEPTISAGERPQACWDRGFESHRGHGHLSLVSVVCCQVEVSATSWSLVQRSPTDCAASLCVI